MQVLSKADVVTPVCTILSFLQVPAMPSMSVYGKELTSAIDVLMKMPFATYLWYARS